MRRAADPATGFTRQVMTQGHCHPKRRYSRQPTLLRWVSTHRGDCNRPKPRALGHESSEQADNSFFIIWPKARGSDGGCTLFTVPLHYFEAREDWPSYRGRPTFVLAQAHQPRRTSVHVVQLPNSHIPAPGELTGTAAYQAKASQSTAGHRPMGRYTTDPLLRQLHDFLDDRDGDAMGPEGYHQPLTEELHHKLPGYFGPPRPM